MENSKVLLIGSSGQLGQTLFHMLKKDFNVFILKRPELNITEKTNLRNHILDISPDFLINACAYTNVDDAETNLNLAFELNSEFPGFLSEVCKDINCLLVHYSTDYVFDGNKKGSYDEKDNCSPVNVYGKSKRQGEENILVSGCRNLIFRTSWVYSNYRRNFFLTILNLATKKDQLRIIDDQEGSPTSCSLISNVTKGMLLKSRNKDFELGLYHLTSSGKTTWYGFAKEIVRLARNAGLKLKVSEEDIIPINTNQFPTAAKRPQNSVLDCSKLTHLLDEKLLTWQSCLEEVVKEVPKN
tara:strand:- start:138 stop:1031 length:894 start_codon:yes stop_codon:yes gene_type:complete